MAVYALLVLALISSAAAAPWRCYRTLDGSTVCFGEVGTPTINPPSICLSRPAAPCAGPATVYTPCSSPSPSPPPCPAPCPAPCNPCNPSVPCDPSNPCDPCNPCNPSDPSNPCLY